MTAPIPEDVRASIAADYATGLTAAAVAKKHGVGTASVYRIAHGEQARRGRKFPAHLLDAAVEDYLDSGDPIRTVAARHPMSEDTLRLELRRRDVTRSKGETITAAKKTAAINDFLDGMSIARVAQKHGISRSAISSWLDKAGLGAENRDDGESPNIYSGGWELVGGVRRPLAPVRQWGAA